MATKIKIFLLFLFLGFTQISFAGVVPGTINKADYTSSNTCNTSTNSYSPSGGSCYQGSCKSGHYYNYSCNPTSCNCVTIPVTCNPKTGACSGGGQSCSTCYSTCTAYQCDVYYNLPSTNGTLTFINYLLNNQNPTYSSAGSNRKLGVDLSQSCNKWSDGTNHTAPTMGGTVSCVDGSSNYYVGGSNGSCNKRGSTDNLISSFTQLGAVSRTTPSNSDSSCTVEGRYATPDDIAPTVSVAGPANNVILSDTSNWCNMQKYLKSDYGTSTNPSLPGCEFYKSKITHTAGLNPDLLEGGFDITVSDSSSNGQSSGISKVYIEFGNCETTYNFATDVASLVASTTSANGVVSNFSQSLVIKGTTTNTYGGVTVSSLLSKFGKTRFDKCLLDGKNFLRITTWDNARSDSDGTTYSRNTIVAYDSSTTKWINVDASPSSLNLTGDLKRLYETTDGTNSVASSCFVSSNGGVLIDGKWRNYTLSGGIQAGDPYSEADRSSCGKCSAITKTTSSCVGTLLTNQIWVSPVGVNPTTGRFDKYQCDGVDINSATDCKTSCKTNYTLQNGSCVADSVINYCRAGGPIKCTVAPTGPQVATCTDGTKNGTETGVDCGGTCTACTTTVTTNYPGCDTPDITVGSYTVSACNIGATTASTDWTVSRGQYFQWGRNKGFAYGDTTQQSTTIAGSIGLNVGTDTYGFVSDSLFAFPYPYTWASTDITNNWGDTTNTIIARQGSCASGYHIPSQSEWSGIVTAGGWGTNGTNMQTTLKLPYAGDRSWIVGTSFSHGGSNGFYWSSSPSGTHGYSLLFSSTSINPSNSGAHANGFSVRCFKN